MRRIGQRLGASLCFFSLLLIPLASLGEESAPSGLHDCGKRVCETWAPKGGNTCRVCTIPQCRDDQNGGELLVGQKNQSECYEGHDAPPADEAPPSS